MHLSITFTYLAYCSSLLHLSSSIATKIYSLGQLFAAFINYSCTSLYFYTPFFTFGLQSRCF